MKLLFSFAFMAISFTGFSATTITVKGCGGSQTLTDGSTRTCPTKDEATCATIKSSAAMISAGTLVTVTPVKGAAFNATVISIPANQTNLQGSQVVLKIVK